MIVKDRKRLEKECKPCGTVSEGLLIGEELLKILQQQKDGVGLAANQIGINKRVCLVYVTKPDILVNPTISGKFGKTFFQEGCLSFPGDYVLTERWTNIIVKADNHKEQLFFNFEKDPLECVCVQHEIDHLDGITMFDRAINMEDLDVKG